MAKRDTYNISPDVLIWARTSLGMTIEDAAQKIGVKTEHLQSWERGESKPTYRQLENLAYKVFKRPLAILFLSEAPVLPKIEADFRNLTNSAINNFSPTVRLAVRKAKSLQTTLNDLAEGSGASKKITDFTISIQDPVETAAKFSQFTGLTMEVQTSWRGSESAYYEFKSIIEALGVYVFQFDLPMEEARAFCLIGKNPIIFLSTDDSIMKEVISLIDEACHLHFNTPGIV